MSAYDEASIEALRADLDYITDRVNRLQEELEQNPRMDRTDLWACLNQKYAIKRKIHAIEFRKSRE